MVSLARFAALMLLAWSAPGQTLTNHLVIDSAKWTTFAPAEPANAIHDPEITIEIGQVLFHIDETCNQCLMAALCDRASGALLLSLVLPGMIPSLGAKTSPPSEVMQRYYETHGLCRFAGSVCEVSIVENQLCFWVSRTNGIAPADYQKTRDAELHTHFEGAQTGYFLPRYALDLERLFGAGVLDQQPHRSPIAKLVRLRVAEKQLEVDFASALGKPGQIVVDSDFVPRRIFIDGKEKMILDRGFVQLSAASQPTTGLQWLPATREKLSVAGGISEVIVRPGTCHIPTTQALPQTRQVLLALDPESGAVLTRWQKWKVKWAPEYFRLGPRLFAIGWQPELGDLIILPSVDQAPFSPQTADALTEIEARLLQAIQEHRHPKGYRISLARLFGLQISDRKLERVTPRVTPQGTVVIELNFDQASDELALEIDSHVKVISAIRNGRAESVPPAVVAPIE